MESIKAVFWKPDPAAQVRDGPASAEPDLMNGIDAKMQQFNSVQHPQTRPGHGAVKGA